MKAGSKVHKKLEMQVHEVVPVDVQTREDGWGLRIWNMIQGLRTLRATGLTRELEVWAQIDGQVVNGIIDELGYECPDPELQAGVDASLAEASDEVPADTQRVYLTDVKSRALRNRGTLPSGASLRPTQMQLMLYRHLLLTLCNSTIDDAVPVLARSRIDPHGQFSDQFISEISSLDFSFLPGNALDSGSNADDVPSSSGALASQQSAAHELSEHNTPLSLWSLMLQELAATFGPNPDSCLSPVLRAEFRAQGSGEFLGQRTFIHDEELLASYVEDKLGWWRGQREPRGVQVQEAFKCGICEFAEGCEWRLSKVREGVERMRMRDQAKGRRSVS
jgi:exonuclease V